jgi:hypothetical protein
MGIRPAALAAALLASSLPACSQGEELLAGAEYPEQWRLEVPSERVGSREPDLTIAWHFRTEDCLSCDSFDYAVRRIQATLQDSVPLLAVHVGSDRQAEIPRHFFRSRRIRVTKQVTVSERQFRQVAGNTTLPSVVLVKDGQVAWTSAAPDGVATPVELATFVQMLRAAP